MTIGIRQNLGSFHCEHDYCSYQHDSPKVRVARVRQFDRFYRLFSGAHSKEQ